MTGEVTHLYSRELEKVACDIVGDHKDPQEADIEAAYISDGKVYLRMQWREVPREDGSPNKRDL